MSFLNFYCLYVFFELLQTPMELSEASLWFVGSGWSVQLVGQSGRSVWLVGLSGRWASPWPVAMLFPHTSQLVNRSITRSLSHLVGFLVDWSTSPLVCHQVVPICVSCQQPHRNQCRWARVRMPTIHDPHTPKHLPILP